MGITTPKGSSLEGDKPGVAYDERQLVKNYSEVVASNAAATGAVDIDLTDGNNHQITLTGNITLTFSNPVAAIEMSPLTLLIIQDGTGGHAITWPASVQWAGGTAPTLTTTLDTVSILTFFTNDGGVTWYGFLSGDNFS